MKYLIRAIMLASCLLLVSCGTAEGTIDIKGTVRRIGLEGGFWGITVDDGRKFDPVDLPDGYKKDGLAVKARLRPRDDLAGTHMWGQMVEVVEIVADSDQ